MKILKKKIIASSPEADVPTKKVNTTGFPGWMEKLKEENMKGVTNNFRQRAERVGVPPERVSDFKYWLRENKYE